MTLRLEDELHRAVRKVAAESGTTISSIVREVLAEEVRRRKASAERDAAARPSD